MSLDFYEKKAVPFASVLWIIICVVGLIALQVRWCGGMTDADRDCAKCPSGSKGKIVQGYWSPECVCEVSR